MDLLDTLERKFGRLAVPGLIRIVAGFQFLVFVLAAINPSLVEVLVLDPQRILHGEVWRLFSYMFIPRTFSPIWILFLVLFLWFISDGLEAAWGAFRVNLFVIASMACLTFGSFVVYFLTRKLGIGYSVLNYSGEYVYHAIFLAFAVLYPNQVIQLMLILPVKIKYLAYILAAFLILAALREPFTGILIISALTPFNCWAGPMGIRALRQRARVSERRGEYVQNSLPQDEAFHRCHTCGKTERDDPHLEFRVDVDDEEYCVPCLEARKTPEEEPVS